MSHPRPHRGTPCPRAPSLLLTLLLALEPSRAALFTGRWADAEVDSPGLPAPAVPLSLPPPAGGGSSADSSAGGAWLARGAAASRRRRRVSRRKSSGPSKALAAGYGALVTGIFQANENAKSCTGKLGCLGDPVTVKLVQGAAITASFPPLDPNAHLIVTCAGSSCVVDGQGKWRIFQSGPRGGPAARLDVSNLHFTRAKKGVFYNFWGTIVAKGCTFSGNQNGVELSPGAEGGYPPRTYENCSFISNKGTPIRRGSVAAAGVEPVSDNSLVTISSSLFQGNHGSKRPPHGGAVAIFGRGKVQISETSFTGNQASIGGAIAAVASEMHVVRSSFTGNTAYSGVGDDVYGTTTISGDCLVSLCFTVLSSAGTSAQGTNSAAVYIETPDNPTGYTYLNLCNTTLPHGSQVTTAKSTKDCSIC